MRTVTMIELDEWDGLVKETYNRPYSFQQQDGCKSRGTYELNVPTEGYDFENDSIPEVVNGSERGVSFKAWLARDPQQSVGDREDYAIGLWWARNFYPDVDIIANDLHSKGLLEAGEYVINIDW